jgi:hypothetical protein
MDMGTLNLCGLFLRHSPRSERRDLPFRVVHEAEAAPSPRANVRGRETSWRNPAATKPLNRAFRAAAVQVEARDIASLGRTGLTRTARDLATERLLARKFVADIN